MPPVFDPPDPAPLAAQIAVVRHGVLVALWLSAGMILAILMLGLMAFGRRRAALLAGAAYSASLCLIPVGHAQVLGPCGLVLSIGGWIWPQRRGRPPA